MFKFYKVNMLMTLIHIIFVIFFISLINQLVKKYSCLLFLY